MIQINYRKDIDGLRAFAVLSVIFFHLDFGWIKSGFLGVDIFFVISGYLITSIIYRDLQNNTFSIKGFYLKRIRRISPALIFVLIFTTILAWAILLPAELRQYAKSMLSALASVSNLYFFNSMSFGYFGTDSSIIPLLHTWSLGIEEQFYIFWPLILIFLFNLNIGWKQRKNISIYYKSTIITTILIILSLFYFFIESGASYYYSPFTRSFELLFGCLLALHAANKKIHLNTFVSNILGIIGLLLMLIPILFVDATYPSITAIEVCLGATIFIYTGLSSNSSVINKFFSLKPFVLTGLISYSLYLWHWPIIAYVNYLSIEKTALVKSLIILFSFIAAIFTYFFIEKTFRYGFKTTFKKTFFYLWILPIIVACVFALLTKRIPDFGYNKPIGDFNIITQQTDGSFVFGYPNWQHKFKDYTSIWKDDGFEDKNKIDNRINTVGSLINKNYDVVIFGDSHSEAAAPMINVWTSNLHLSTLLVGGTQLTIMNMIEDKKIDKYVKEIINKAHPKYFIMVGWWNSYTSHMKQLSNNKDLHFMDNVIKILEKNNIQPVILLDWPSLKGLRPACGMTKVNVLLGIKNCDRSLKTIMNDQSIEISYIQSLQKKYKNLKVIDPKKVICKNGLCSNVLDNNIIYMDSMDMAYYGLNNAHLNPKGSYLIGKDYLEEFGNPLQ